MIASGPTMHWVGSETLVCLWVEDWEVNTLANSGSQVNTVIPNYVHHYDFSMLPLGNLMDHPLSLVGLGGTWTHLLSFVILRVQVKEIMGYNEDVVFLVVPDKSEFAHHVPIVIKTCTLGRIVNVIKESEMDQLSMPWVVVRVSRLLSQWGNVVEDPEAAGDSPTKQGAAASMFSEGLEVDELVYIKESVRLGHF